MNRYYEKNLTTGEVTTYYYLGDRLVGKRTGTTLNYIHQDHLMGTALVTDTAEPPSAVSNSTPTETHELVRVI